MTKILAINGSYREAGITDQAVKAMVETLQSFDVEVEEIVLRDYPLEFCTNCRACTQEQGDGPGHCVLDDGMNEIVQKIEAAEGFILASPTNFGAVTADFKRFMERLVMYAYWPWGEMAPKYRKDGSCKKKAVLISSSAAPGIMGRLFFDTRKQLKLAAKAIGAEAKGTLFTGMIAKEPGAVLPESARRKINALAKNLT